MIRGNIKGIKDYILTELEGIYDIKVNKDRLAEEEIIFLIARVSNEINREINVAIDRRGNVVDISMGDSSTAPLPDVLVQDNRLSGIRIIHTHPGGSPRLSNVDISALIKLKLDCISAIGIRDNKITGIGMGFCKVENNNLVFELLEPKNVEETINYPILQKIIQVEDSIKKELIVEEDKEYAVLVGLDDSESLDELKELARACDIEVVGKFSQKRSKVDKNFFIGSGKAQELAIYKQVQQANLIIFDDELNGIQVRNLEAITGCKVIDRTILILEIFARRAKTREAKIQVELARLKYQSGRLLGYGVSMSRLGGGVGAKGAGETKLELDRRRIRENIHSLNKELEGIRKTRALQREKREESGIPKISLVGYTNVGKSTLRNLLANLYPADNNSKKEEVFAENMLFATLDTTTRAIVLPDKRVASMTDTVGFVRKLPHELVEAFKSTLEEVVFADLILHIVDASSPTCIEQIVAVEAVLEELEANNKPNILVLNKVDMASEEDLEKIYEKYGEYNIVEISAKDEINIDGLLDEVIKTLPEKAKECTYLIPYSETKLGAYLHENAIVLSEDYEGNGIKIVAKVNEEIYNKLVKFMI